MLGEISYIKIQYPLFSSTKPLISTLFIKLVKHGSPLVNSYWLLLVVLLFISYLEMIFKILSADEGEACSSLGRSCRSWR